MKWRKTAAFILFCGFLALCGYETFTKWPGELSDDKNTIRFVAEQAPAGDVRPSQTPKEIDYNDIVRSIEKSLK